MAVLRHDRVAGIACCRGTFTLVAGDAGTHASVFLQCDSGPVCDGTVTFLTLGPSRNVCFMAEGYEGWNSVDPNPGNGIFVLRCFSKTLDVGLVRCNTHVTGHAFWRLRHRESRTISTRLMTVVAGHLCRLDMELMIERYRLGRRICRGRMRHWKTRERHGMERRLAGSGLAG